MNEFAKTIIERWGFPTLVALAAGYVLRQDVLLPLVAHHATFLQTIAETQKEISTALKDQTRLLYAIKDPSVSVPPPPPDRN
jgi:hypothetical protein